MHTSNEAQMAAQMLQSPQQAMMLSLEFLGLAGSGFEWSPHGLHHSSF